MKIVTKTITECKIKDSKFKINFESNLGWTGIKKTEPSDKELRESKGKITLDRSHKFKYYFKYKDSVSIGLVVLDEFWDLLKEKYYNELAEYDQKLWWGDYINFQPTIEEFQSAKKKDFIVVCISDHTFRTLDGCVIPDLRSYDYIKGFRQKCPNNDWMIDWYWEPLVKHVKKHRFVTRCEELEVEYCNRDFPGQKYLNFDLYIPSTSKKSKLFYNLHSLIDNPLLDEDLDILGVNRFRKN